MQSSTPKQNTSFTKQPWVTPSLSKLPPLTTLTLQTGGGIPGADGGSTVF